MTLDHWSEEKALTAQLAVAEVVSKKHFGGVKSSPQATPKLTRCSMNLEIFRKIVGVIIPGTQNFRSLQETHQAAWWKVGGANELARRLLIDGEPNQQSTFMAAYEHRGRDVAKIAFSETSIGSDFGMVEEKLALAMPKQAETAPPPAGAGCKAAQWWLSQLERASRCRCRRGRDAGCSHCCSCGFECGS